MHNRLPQYRMCSRSRDSRGTAAAEGEVWRLRLRCLTYRGCQDLTDHSPSHSGKPSSVRPWTAARGLSGRVLRWTCMSVRLSARISQKQHIQTSPNFRCVLPLWPWLGPHMAALFTLCVSGFVDAIGQVKATHWLTGDSTGAAGRSLLCAISNNNRTISP